mmetsp:Transcript_41149/g.103745  ORF Transcript_41149/g.103745 Transcript_41149/m.103745 type:complete len:997 (+) Transcript_41149:123-3113(+)
MQSRITLFLLLLLSAVAVNAQQHCGPNMILSGSTGGVVSEPVTGMGTYLRDQTCSWIIETGSADTILFEFIYLDTELSFDYVTIYQGDIRSESVVVVGQYSGSEVPAVPIQWATGGRRFSVLFTSDQLVVGTGFRIEYSLGSCPDRCSAPQGYCHSDGCHCSGGYRGANCAQGGCADGCGESYGGGSCDSLSASCVCSPGYYGGHCADTHCSGVTRLRAAAGTFADHARDHSGSYLANQRCGWLIQPEDDDQSPVHSIQLIFQRFDLEADYDYVRVYDGSSAQAERLLGVFTGQELPPTLYAGSGAMFVQLESDAGVERSGFEASYSTYVCPAQCSGHGSCQAGACHCDPGRGGDDCSQRVCTDQCGGPSRGSCQADGTCVCEPGYSGEACEVCDQGSSSSECPRECSGRQSTLSAEQDSFTDGSDEVDSRAECSWLIQPDSANPADAVAISFTRFSLDLNRAFLTVYQGGDAATSPVVGRFTGSLLPATLTVDLASSGAQAVLVELSSRPDAVPSPGFAAHYRLLRCPSSCSRRGHCLAQGGDDQQDPEANTFCVCDPGYTGATCAQTTCMPPTSGEQCSGEGTCDAQQQVCQCSAGRFGPICAETQCSGVKQVVAAQGLLADHSDTQLYAPDQSCRWEVDTGLGSSATTLVFPLCVLEQGADVVRVFYRNEQNVEVAFAWSSHFEPYPLLIPDSSFQVQFLSDALVEYEGFVLQWAANQVCPASCSDSGLCIAGRCYCYGDTTGADCSQSRLPVPLPIEGGVVSFSVEQYEWAYFSMNVSEQNLDAGLDEVEITLISLSDFRESLPVLYLGSGVDQFPTLTDFLERDTNFEYSSTHRLSLHPPALAAGEWVVGVYGYKSDRYTIEAVVGDGDYSDDDGGGSGDDDGWVWAIIGIVFGGIAVVLLLTMLFIVMRARHQPQPVEGDAKHQQEEAVEESQPRQSQRTTKDGYDEFHDERSDFAEVNLADDAAAPQADFSRGRTTADGFHEFHNESRA